MMLFIFSDVPRDQNPFHFVVVIAETKAQAVQLALEASEQYLLYFLKKGMAGGRFQSTDVAGAFQEYYPNCEVRPLAEAEAILSVINGTVVAQQKTASV